MCAAVLVVLAGSYGAPRAAAAPGSGGSTYAEPEITAVKCAGGDTRRCAQGALLRLSGNNLAATRKVVFLGGAGSRDDRRAIPRSASAHRVLVSVPATAASGMVRVSPADDEAPRVALRVLAAPRAQGIMNTAALSAGVFPVQGAHDYGTFVNAFGGGRGHQGQDVLADCGIRLVAALDGQVTTRRYHPRAGNFVVVQADDGTSQVYMHLRSPATVQEGQRVSAGQPLGHVGQTGRSSACHLHFELWTAPGWQTGGEAVDPLPLLRQWEHAKPTPA